MNDCSCEIYLHLVWATKYREPTIPLAEERSLHRILRAEALRLRCSVLAVNGTEDHIHLLVKLGHRANVARLLNQMKGVSSSYLNAERRCDDSQPRFRWQAGYGIASIGQNQITRIIDYIDRQKEHHAAAETRTAWEPVGQCE